MVGAEGVAHGSDANMRPGKDLRSDTTSVCPTLEPRTQLLLK